jgi:hypothetical protein
MLQFIGLISPLSCTYEESPKLGSKHVDVHALLQEKSGIGE